MLTAERDLAEKLTRRDCALLGATLFAAVVIAGYALAWLIAGLRHDAFVDAVVLRQFAVAAFIAAPMAAALGSLLGAEAHRLAMDTLAPSYMRLALVWLVMIAASLVLILIFKTFFVLIFFQPGMARRTGPARRLLPLCYALIYAGCILGLLNDDTDALPAVLAIGGFVGVYLADAILIETITNWRDERRLAHGAGQFQYSLSTLLSGLLILGAWASGAVLLLRN